MFALSRLTARVAVVASFATLMATACSPDSNGPANPAFSAGVAGLSSSQSGSANFAVLANAAVTCTDGTISGSVGTFQATPTGSITQTNCPISGAIDVGGGAAVAAFNAFLTQYDAYAAVPCDVVLTGTLAGVTLAPGVYCFDAAATLTGVLTLNGPANGVWLFKIGTLAPGALTGTNFSVVLAGGAQRCNVAWWVDAAATLTDSHFIGDILAGAAITLTRGSFDGNIWSKADVTITGTALVGCAGNPGEGNGDGNGDGQHKEHCNQGVGNGPEGCDPGNSNHRHSSNDEDGGTPGHPGRH